MRTGLIILIVVLAVGSIAGVVVYRNYTQEESQNAKLLSEMADLKQKLAEQSQDNDKNDQACSHYNLHICLIG